MILEGDTSVIDAIKEKKHLMGAGEAHEHIKPLLIVGGGLMQGVYGAGAVLALDELGYRNTFTSAAGISAGACTVGYFLANNTEVGMSVLWEEACSKEFFNPWRFSSVFDFDYVLDVIEGETGKPIDGDAVLKHETDFYIGLSEYATGKPIVYKPTSELQIQRALRASTAMPGPDTEPTLVEGVRYADGSSTIPFVKRGMYEDIEATHILDITNQDKHEERSNHLETFINATLFRRRMPKALRVAAATRRARRADFSKEVLAAQSKPTCLTWGDGFISPLERDPVKVQEAVERSRLWWKELLK